MKSIVIMGAAALLAASGPAAYAAGPERNPNSMVEVSVVDASGKSIDVSALPAIEQQRVTTLRKSLLGWGKQQSGRWSIKIDCKYESPLIINCTITVQLS